MRFVVEHENVLHSHQLGHDALQHLPFGLQRLERRTMSLQQRAAAFRDFKPFAQFERVIVGDDDLCLIQFAHQITRHQLASRVVGVEIIRLEHLQAITDGDARRHDKKATREALG